MLAVITPYAQLSLNYVDGINSKMSFTSTFHRRTDVMPPVPSEIKHHPSSVDNLLVESLIRKSKYTHLKKFLSKEFTSISPALAEKLINELGKEFEIDMDITDLNKKQIHQITHLMREAKFDMPSAECLSPAGEYNLRLGIQKEMQPDIIATHTSLPAAIEGHPFQVEAAVSIGGMLPSTRSGLHIFRFANRIPLLFEGGNDVVSIVANHQIRWNAYKIRVKEDKVGVFVSIVSTKIPFKGTSKEYLGDDKGILNSTIQHAITQCCLHLKKRIEIQRKMADYEEKQKNMSKYIPDVSRSIMSILNAMSDIKSNNRKEEEEIYDEKSHINEITGSILFGNIKELNSKKRKLTQADIPTPSQDLLTKGQNIIDQVKNGHLSADVLSTHLHTYVKRMNTQSALAYIEEQGRARSGGDGEDCWIGGWTRKLGTSGNEGSMDIYHQKFSMKLLPLIQ